MGSGALVDAKRHPEHDNLQVGDAAPEGATVALSCVAMRRAASRSEAERR